MLKTGIKHISIATPSSMKFLLLSLTTSLAFYGAHAIVTTLPGGQVETINPGGPIQTINPGGPIKPPPPPPVFHCSFGSYYICLCTFEANNDTSVETGPYVSNLSDFATLGQMFIINTKTIYAATKV